LFPSPSPKRSIINLERVNSDKSPDIMRRLPGPDAEKHLWFLKECAHVTEGPVKVIDEVLWSR
jgi:hypothetical protein